MHLLHLVLLLLLLLLPTDKGRRSVVALQQGKYSAPHRNRLHFVPLSLLSKAQAAVFEYFLPFFPCLDFSMASASCNSVRPSFRTYEYVSRPDHRSNASSPPSGSMPESINLFY